MATKHKRVQLEYSLPVIGSFTPFAPSEGAVIDIHKVVIDNVHTGSRLYLSLNPNSLSRILEMQIEGRIVNMSKWMYASDVIIEEVGECVGRTIKYRHGKHVMGSLLLS